MSVTSVVVLESLGGRLYKVRRGSMTETRRSQGNEQVFVGHSYPATGRDSFHTIELNQAEAIAESIVFYSPKRGGKKKETIVFLLKRVTPAGYEYWLCASNGDRILLRSVAASGLINWEDQSAESAPLPGTQEYSWVPSINSTTRILNHGYVYNFLNPGDGDTVADLDMFGYFSVAANTNFRHRITGTISMPSAAEAWATIEGSVFVDDGDPASLNGALDINGDPVLGAIASFRNIAAGAPPRSFTITNATAISTTNATQDDFLEQGVTQTLPPGSYKILLQGQISALSGETSATPITVGLTSTITLGAVTGLVNNGYLSIGAQYHGGVIVEATGGGMSYLNQGTPVQSSNHPTLITSSPDDWRGNRLRYTPLPAAGTSCPGVYRGNNFANLFNGNVYQIDPAQLVPDGSGVPGRTQRLLIAPLRTATTANYTIRTATPITGGTCVTGATPITKSIKVPFLLTGPLVGADPLDFEIVAIAVKP